MSRLGAAITWLGHSAFHIECEPDGPGFLFDPWLNNPRVPANARDLAMRARIILVTHGHADHSGGTVDLALESGATVMTSVEMGMELSADGLPESQLVAFNIGGGAEAHGLRATLVQAFHSSSLPAADGRPRELGSPCGFVVELPNGVVIYNTGDTGVFGDMSLVAELYQPTILMLPIGDFYTMGPKQAAKAVSLVNPDWIIPQHYGTFPGLPGTAADFRDALEPRYRERLLILEPGTAVT